MSRGERGVSLATVSAVLNQSSYFSPELTARVNQAAKPLDHRINALARSLKQGWTQTVGMRVPTFGAPDPFFGEVVQGVETTLRPTPIWVYPRRRVYIRKGS